MLQSFRCLVAVALLALSSCAMAQDDYLNHLVFTNSSTPDNDFYTGARSVAPSTLSSSNGRLPVEVHTFFTPPNALRLEYFRLPIDRCDQQHSRQHAGRGINQGQAIRATSEKASGIHGKRSLSRER